MKHAVAGAGIVLTAVLTLLSVETTPASQSPAPQPFVLHINQAIDPSCLSVTTYLRPSSGGGRTSYGQRLPSLKMSGSQDIVIDTVLEGPPATSLRLVVYCHGYRFALVHIPSLLEPGSRRKAIDLVPLATVPMPGRVALPAGEDPSQFRLEIGFDASAVAWSFFFRDLRNTAVSFPSSSTTVAETTPTSDGSFVARVPDFANDPAVAASPGTFAMFFAHGPRQSYNLSVVGSSSSLPRVPMAASYTDEIVLRADVRKGDTP